MFDHDGTLVNTMGLSPQAYEGIMDLVQALTGREVPLYVWTARSKVSTIRILEELKLRRFFKDICGSDTANAKPSQAGLDYLVPEVDPENVVVIGDSLGDIVGAKSFGAYPVGVAWSDSVQEIEATFLKTGARSFFTDVKKLKAFLFERI